MNKEDRERLAAAVIDYGWAEAFETFPELIPKEIEMAWKDFQIVSAEIQDFVDRSL